METDERSTYGTTVAQPDEKSGVEVGGGEKAALKDMNTDTDEEDKSDPESDLESGSKSDDRHEKRPEGPHADPENTDYGATPGAGALPDAGDQDATGG